MTSLSRDARIAGLGYVVMAPFAPLRLVYIPGKLFVEGDASATANNITAHEWLFRMGIACDLITGTLALVLTLLLYRLLRRVNETLAVVMVILGGLMVAPIYFLNTLNDAAALLLARGADFLSVFDKPQRNALAMLFLRLHHQGVVANEMFWGLWLLPLALLVIRSGFLPRFLGYWLMVNGVSYVVLSLTGVLFPQYETMLSDAAFPVLMGEIAFMLWLLIMGAKERTLAAPAS